MQRPSETSAGVQQTFGPVLVPGKSVPKPFFPVYPAFAYNTRGLGLSGAILAGAFFMGAFAPTFSTTQSSGGPTSVQVSRLQIQYQSVFGPVFVPVAATPIDQMGWRPIYPARPGRAEVHASQQRAFFRPETPLPAAPALSWAPVYPDRAEGPRGLQASQQRAHVLDPFPRTRTDDYAWRPVYPDQVFRRELTAAHLPAVFKNPTPLPAAPALSWAPIYPASVRGRAPEVGGWYARPSIEPPDIARLGWRGQYPDSLEHRRAQPTGWYVRPLNEPPDIARLGWHGQAPAQLDARRPHPSGWVVLSPFPVTAGVEAFGWRGEWPDIVSRLERQPWLAPASFKNPTPLPAAPALSWGPLYPSLIEPGRSILTAAQRAVFFDAFPIAVPTAQLGWRGWWPDLLNRREVHASQIPSYFKSPLPMPAAPALSWHPVYPDRIDPARTLGVALQRAVFFDPFPISVPTSQFGWRGQWPDLLFRLERRPWLESPAYFKSPLPQPAAPVLSWRPQYPDRAEGPRGLHVSAQRAVFLHPFPITAVDAFAWWGEYPDLLFRSERRPWLAPTTFKSPLPLAAAQLLSWHPLYPDRIDPARALSAAYQRPFFFDARPFPAVQVGWFWEWPDLLNRREAHPSQAPSYFSQPYPLAAAPLLSWQGEWPADFDRGFLHASRIPSYFEPSGFQPAQAVPPLAWLPIFPDFARGDTQIRWELFVLDYATIVVPLPPLPCGVEAHNVIATFPYADGVMLVTPTAGGVMVTIVSSTDPTVTPDE